MCIAVFMWEAHPLYPLLLLFNRDEYLDRPTKPVSWWEGGNILGGRDEVAGGTWLACSKQGKIAFLTNVREASPIPQAETRGDLPLRFLESTKSPKEFAEQVLEEADMYNGFNLILIDVCSKTMVYVTNRPKGEACVEEVSPGIHVLSNAKLDTPWQKAQRLDQNFKDQLSTYGDEEVPVKVIAEELMRDTTKADISSLPGIRPPDMEYEMSSIYIQRFDTSMGSYGTRSTTALSVKATGEIYFHEKYLADEEWLERDVDFQIQKMPFTNIKIV